MGVSGAPDPLDAATRGSGFTGNAPAGSGDEAIVVGARRPLNGHATKRRDRPQKGAPAPTKRPARAAGRRQRGFSR